MPELTDIIHACKKGEKSAQCFVYEQFSPRMRALCFRYVKEKQDVEDILHDSFLWIFTKIAQYKGTGSFEGWMRRIFIGTAIKFIKAKQQTGFSFGDDEFLRWENRNAIHLIDRIEYEGQSENPTDIDFTEQDVFAMLQDLPDGYRVVFNLYVFEKYSHKEIAEMLGVSEGTSKSQLSKARKTLQKMLTGASQKKGQAEANKEYKDFLRVVI